MIGSRDGQILDETLRTTSPGGFVVFCQMNLGAAKDSAGDFRN